MHRVLGQEFVAANLNWSFCRATRAAQKTPSNTDQLCLDQFLRLTLTIYNCAIFHACFYINIDQTNIMYQPANTATYKEVSSKQVTVIGQEEKLTFTVVVGISASGDALHFRSSTAAKLPLPPHEKHATIQGSTSLRLQAVFFEHRHVLVNV